MRAHYCRAAEPGLLGDVLDWQVRVLEQFLGEPGALVEDPLCRRRTGLAPALAGKGAWRHVRVASEAGDVQWLVEVLECPGEGWLE